MATHDYIISNASGAAVRADLNNALAAIVSNNSNATSPSTTYAFQFWADTTTGQLKIRNAANSAWITLMELDGTMLMEDGTVSAPGLAFASDTNTGFFRSAADKINFATGGAERLEIGSSEVVFNDPSNDVDFRVESNGNTHMLYVDAGNDAVGIGESAPANLLHVKESDTGVTPHASAQIVLERSGTNYLQLLTANTGTQGILFGDADDNDRGKIVYDHSSDHLRVEVAANEALRIDSSGRLLLGTSNPRENFYQTTGQNWQHQIEGTSYLASGQAQITNSNDALGAYINLAKSRGTSVGSNTIVNDDDDLGIIDFHGNDGTDFVHAARIVASVDGTPGSNDMPGRLSFLTTADAGTSPTERVRIDSSGRVGINTPSPDQSLTVNGGVGINNTGGGGGSPILTITNNSGNPFINCTNNSSALTFGYNSSEIARFDSNGRLLVGLTSARATKASASIPSFQIEGTGDSDSRMNIGRNSNADNGPEIHLYKTRGTSLGSNTVVQDNDFLGTIAFFGADGTDLFSRGADITAAVDGTPGSDDMPTRLSFGTCDDGSASATERVRITSKGAFKALGNASAQAPDDSYHELNINASNSHAVRIDQFSTSYAQAGGGIFHINCRTAHSSGWTFGGWYSGNVSDREFNFRGDGNAFADGSFTGGGADYAEYFEWSDDNSANEDRRGISVVLDGNNIREAVAGEEPIGVISGNPSVVGDAAWNNWSEKYLRDDYGSYALDENGHRQLNPDFDPDIEYVPREDRPEWGCVGLMGKLRVRKGQVTGTRWVKMRDVSATVEEWLVR